MKWEDRVLKAAVGFLALIVLLCLLQWLYFGRAS